MEHLFKTNISADGQNIMYDVVFDHEKYIFNAEGAGKEHPSFSFTREHDEWHSADPIPGDMRSQAINALERYLMKQH